jgi:hypothetical protein
MASIRRFWWKYVTRLFFLLCHVGLSFTQSAQVLEVSPTSGHSLGGYVVTVAGSGFAVGSAGYKCRFTCGASEMEVAADPPQGADELQCTMSKWLHPNCTTTLRVLEGNSTVLSGTPSFKLDAAWSAMSVNEIFFGGGASLELLGAGFAPEQSYKCVFNIVGSTNQWGADIPAVYNSPSKLVCNPPAYSSGGVVEVSVFDGTTKLLKVPPSNNILTLTTSGWSQAEPQLASAAANFTLKIAGQGFQIGATQPYRATFRSGTDQIQAPCSAVSATLLSCSVTAWQYGEAAATVSLSQGSTVIGRSSGGAFLLRFIASWHTISGVLSGPVAGGRNLTLRGTGFVASYGGYVCNFEGTAGVKASSAAIFVDQSTLICITPAWPGMEQNVTLSLISVFHSAVAKYLGPAGGDVYEFIASWTRLKGPYSEDLLRPFVTAASLGSTTVTIVGAGFSSTTGYYCVFSCYDASMCGMTTIQTQASPTGDLTMITCSSPVWTRFDDPESAQSAAKVSVFRSSGLELTRTTPFDNPILFTKASFFSNGASYSGNAGGGVQITLNGARFCHVDASCSKNAYVCHFQKIGNATEFIPSQQCVKGPNAGTWCRTDADCPDGLCIAEFTSTSVASKIVSDTRIVCSSPEWPFSIGQTKLVLYDATYGGRAAGVPVGAIGGMTTFTYTTEVLLHPSAVLMAGLMHFAAVCARFIICIHQQHHRFLCVYVHGYLRNTVSMPQEEHIDYARCIMPYLQSK